jgi:acyl transferase domain-containing protein
MGQPLLAENRVFREVLRDLDDVARGLTGRSILDVLHEPDRSRHDVFDRTLFTHPAIFMTEVALARALEDEGVVPDIVLGSSLGELAALVVAGALSAEDGLEACIAQAEALEAHCAPGGMVAILEDPRLYEEHEWLHGTSTVAGINLARHFVVSAPAAACEAIVRHCQALEIACQRLPVRVAFHSDAMRAAEAPFLERVAHLPFATPKIPILSAARSGWLDEASPAFLWELARAPIGLRDVLDAAARELPATFVDVSPSATLSTFVKHHMVPGSDLVTFPILTPFRTDVSSFARVVAAHRAQRASA